MKMQNTIMAGICVLLTACVPQPVFKDDGYAILRSNNPIININGHDLEGSFRLDVAAGETSAVIVYRTYQQDYHCQFSWLADANTTYEVTNQGNRYPLTLYRWVRTNNLWASRLDPTDPLECVAKSRR